MSDKIKVGIIGCGGIANAKHLPALSHQKNRVDIVAFCDLIPERAKKAAEKYGTENADVYTCLLYTSGFLRSHIFLISSNVSDLLFCLHHSICEEMRQRI